MNVRLKNCPNTINKTKNTKLISGAIQSKTKESFRKPVIRRNSQITDKNKDIYKRRTFSLKDKSSIMTTSKEDNIPEKEISEVDANNSSKEQIFMANALSNDSLDNFLSPQISKNSERESDYALKSETYDSDAEKLSQKLDAKVAAKNNEIKPKIVSGSSPSRAISKDKAENLPVERKKADPKIIIDEMRRYYENEIYVLKRQLQQVGSNILPNEETLQKRCHMLESQLRKSQNETESLTEQVSGLKIQLQSWPNRVTELEEENDTLRGRIEDVRAINQQRQHEIDELHEIIKNLETKLWEQSTGNQQQEKIFLQRLMQEYDHLLKDFDLMKLTHMNNERKLYESKSIANERSAKITELENKVRKIETENNFLKRRLNSEKSFINSSYRGWNRSTYPPAISNFDQETSPKTGSSQELLTYNQTETRPHFDIGMMSMSCYGALPSYSSANDNPDPIPENMRRFEPLKTKINDRYNIGQMNKSMYVRATDEANEVITPTGERRRVAIKNELQYAKNTSKMESASFEMLNEVNESLANQQMTNSISEFRQGDINNGIGRRKKPEYYNRDSWANSRTEEDVELERQYDQLQNEKKQLLTKLSHIPTNCSARNRRGNREQREGLETQLDQIDRQLGLMRMTLKQKNILK